MNKLLKFLQRPFPLLRKNWPPLIIPPFVNLVFTSIAVLSQPHGIMKGEINNIILNAIIFTLIIVLPIVIVVCIFPIIFKRFYTQESWSMWKQLLIYLFVMSVIAWECYIFHNSYTKHPLGSFFRSFLFWIIITFSIGAISTSIITFMMLNEELVINLKDAEELNKYLAVLEDTRIITDEEHVNMEIESITLFGSTKENINIIPEDILYIEASGNYVLINYMSDKITLQTQLRSTISKIEADLQIYSTIIRCHRAFLVNTMHIREVEGNSQGLQLYFHNTTENIPVSRTYIKTIQDKINDFRVELVI